MQTAPALPSLVVQLPFSSREDFLRRHGANLTAGGMFVRTPRVKPAGTEAVVEVRLQGGERLIYARVHVDFVSGGGPRGVAGMGLRFTHVDEPTQRFLDKVAASYLHARSARPPVPPHVGKITWAPEPEPPPAPAPVSLPEPPAAEVAEPAVEAATPVVPESPAPAAPEAPAPADSAQAGTDALAEIPTAENAAGVKGFFKKLFGG